MKIFPKIYQNESELRTCQSELNWIGNSVATWPTLYCSCTVHNIHMICIRHPCISSLQDNKYHGKYHKTRLIVSGNQHISLVTRCMRLSFLSPTSNLKWLKNKLHRRVAWQPIHQCHVRLGLVGLLRSLREQPVMTKPCSIEIQLLGDADQLFIRSTYAKSPKDGLVHFLPFFPLPVNLFRLVSCPTWARLTACYLVSSALPLNTSQCLLSVRTTSIASLTMALAVYKPWRNLPFLQLSLKKKRKSLPCNSCLLVNAPKSKCQNK